MSACSAAVRFPPLIGFILIGLVIGQIITTWTAISDQGVLVLKASVFGAMCLVLAKYGEKIIHRQLMATKPPDSILIVVGTCVVVASIGSLLGFSLAAGAFFARLIFSRDPAVVHMETSLLPLNSVLAPFFFIGIGLSADVTAIDSSILIGAVLCAAAVLGKVIGGGIPALWLTSGAGALPSA